MRASWLVFGVLGGLLLLAGCLGTGPEDTPDDVEAASAEHAPSSGHGAGSSSEDATSSNGSTAREEVPPLGNLTMDGASRERPNATTIVFTWESQIPLDTATVRTRFDLPLGTPFRARAELVDHGEATVGLGIASNTTLYLCHGTGPIPGGAPEPCATRALAREEPEEWTVEVSRRSPGAEQATPFTVQLEVRSLAADTLPTKPALIPAEPAPNATTDPAWPEPGEASVRPGVKIGGGRCTASFVFATPDNATLYIATGSHCFPGWDLGDPVDIARWSVEGTLAYCSWGAQESLLTCPQKRFGVDEGYQQDLALVEIPAEARDQVHPATLVWGGPTELGGAPAKGTQVLTYGNSDLRDGSYGSVNALDSRPGLVLERREGVTVATFPSPAVPMDSGAPVLTEEGPTVGLLSFTDSDGGIPPGASIGISNLAPALDAFEERTGRSIELVTWPLFDPPRGELRENGFLVP